MRYILLLICCGCLNNDIVSPTKQQSIDQVDTAYIDPKSEEIKPPCSISPEYCECMRARGVIGIGCPN